MLKLFGFSVIDTVVATIAMLIAFVVAHQVWFKNLSILPFIIASILLTVPLGIIVHVFCGVNTHLNYLLKLSNKPLV